MGVNWCVPLFCELLQHANTVKVPVCHHNRSWSRILAERAEELHDRALLEEARKALGESGPYPGSEAGLPALRTKLTDTQTKITHYENQKTLGKSGIRFAKREDFPEEVVVRRVGR